MTGVEQSILTQLRARQRRIKAHIAELEAQRKSDLYEAGYIAALTVEAGFVSDLVTELEAKKTKQATRGERAWLTDLIAEVREEQKGKQHV